MVDLPELPIHLAERVTWIQSDPRTASTAGPGGSPEGLDSALVQELARRDAGQPNNELGVVYWARTAIRVDENPALDTARWLARALRAPLLVYHAIAERYPFASDRHHWFLLESALDFHAELRELGLVSAFYLERSSVDPTQRPLIELGRRASVVVTEDMPVAPLDAWTRRLAASIDAPVLAVDTACVVPMRVVGKAYSRAFAFRQATERERATRLRQEWPSIDDALASLPDPIQAPAVEWPMTPLDLSALERLAPGEVDRILGGWIAECAIDHTVPRVPDTRGGSCAGYSRWAEFREHRLHRYAKDRNDPLRHGASRMSAYLHYGCVSPMRIAREAFADAMATSGDGADKYLDELLVWRELAYGFCRFQSPHSGFDALPEWAQQALLEHRDDERAELHSWETLARAETGDRLWDAAQTSLLRHGEVHNNVRMTWGKAFLGWRRDPADALRLCTDLNHRYALDGRDPASYGGILWCFGQFDRPFPPAAPIRGTVRPRESSTHAKRLDLERYLEHVTRPAGGSPRIAVVGGGIAGAQCARVLADQGLDVTVFDKGRGVGGRMSIRRTDHGVFDHGAQFFTVRDPRFGRHVRSWCELGIADRWPARLEHWPPDAASGGAGLPGTARGAESSAVPRLVGTPGMNAVVRHLLDGARRRGAKMQQHQRVLGLMRTGDRWELSVDASDPVQGPACQPMEFDQVLITIPAPQAIELLANVEEAAELAHALEAIRYAPCYAVMARVAVAVEPAFDAARVQDPSVAFVACDDSKPGRERGAGRRVLLHATPDWSREHFDRDREAVGRDLVAAARPVIEAMFGSATPGFEIEAVSSQRWAYALTEAALSDECWFDPSLGLGFGGDGCAGGGRIEAAFLSGSALAGRALAAARAEPSQLRADAGSRQPTLFGFGGE